MSLLGWGSLALSAYSAYQGSQASSNQADSMSAQTAVSQEALDFQKQMYADTQAIYGDTQQNLAEYYAALTPEKYETMGLDAYDEQFKTAQADWDSQMAQRGLSGSGIEAEGIGSMNMQAASDRAGISQGAEQQWANDQLSWLGVGLGQETTAASGMASASANLANTYGSQASVYGSQATAAGQGIGSLISGTMQANAYSPGTVSLGSPFSWGIPTSKSWEQNNSSVASGAIAY